MAQMNVSVTQELRAWADRRVANGQYASTSDYVRDLIRRDEERTERLIWLRAELEKASLRG